MNRITKIVAAGFIGAIGLLFFLDNLFNLEVVLTIQPPSGIRACSVMDPILLVSSNASSINHSPVSFLYSQ